jgi:hypothetical protein
MHFPGMTAANFVQETENQAARKICSKKGCVELLELALYISSTFHLITYFRGGRK